AQSAPFIATMGSSNSRESEPELTEEERARLDLALEVVDKELFEHVITMIPNASLDWILLNIDFGLNYLL
ncbi:hypothetical protein PENTCL1PPCAC_18878, partial [Pristionchus entomophagus]